MFPLRFWVVVVLIMLTTLGVALDNVMAKPRRILLDTDVDLDDVFALIYLLKHNRSEFQLEVSSPKQTDEQHVDVGLYCSLLFLFVCFYHESLFSLIKFNNDLLITWLKYFLFFLGFHMRNISKLQIHPKFI